MLKTHDKLRNADTRGVVYLHEGSFFVLYVLFVTVRFLKYFFIENLIKLKVKMLEKLRQAFGIIKKDLMKTKF
jgi:hypothetical protein